MNTKRFAIVGLAFGVIAFTAVPVQAQFLKKLLQGSSQQNDFQNNTFGNQFGQQYGNGYNNYGQQFGGGFNQFGGYPNNGMSNFNSGNMTSSLNTLDTNADQLSGRIQRFQRPDCSKNRAGRAASLSAAQWRQQWPGGQR